MAPIKSNHRIGLRNFRISILFWFCCFCVVFWSTINLVECYSSTSRPLQLTIINKSKPQQQNPSGSPGSSGSNSQPANSTFSFSSSFPYSSSSYQPNSYTKSTTTTTTSTPSTNDNNDFWSSIWSHGTDSNGTSTTTTSTTTERPSTTPSTTTTTSTKPTTTTSTTTTTTTTMAPVSSTQVPVPIEALGFCTDPGRPSKSQLTPVQTEYSDGESVMYTCDNFISLKQYRKCVRGKWQGETPICGDAFRENDLVYARVYDRGNYRLLRDYNLTDKLVPFTKFGNSFIAERLPYPIRSSNATDYLLELYLERPAAIQMVRISFSVVNHLIDDKLMKNQFDIKSVMVSQFRECRRVSNHSVSPWAFNSTRFDFWYFCRTESDANFEKELAQLSSVIRIETSSQIPITFDLATFILAEQYSNNNNRSEPICGLPEVPVGLDARVVNDQTNYVFTCSAHFKRLDTFGGQFLLKTCGHDLRWHGQLPVCYPTKTCLKFALASSNYLFEVYKYDRIYFVNETDWVPIRGSKAYFRCKDETNIFVGKEIRICGEDGEWSDSSPNCLVTARPESESLRTTSILIIVLSTLIFTFIMSSCTIYCFLRMRNKQSVAPSSGLEMSDAAAYYDTGSYGAGKLDELEVYESIADVAEARYATSYNPTSLQGNALSNQNSTFLYDDGASIPAPKICLDGNEYYDDTVAATAAATTAGVPFGTNRTPGRFYNSYEIMRKPII